MTDIIYVFRDNGTTLCTSNAGDEAWDTPENRRRTFDFITQHEEAERERPRALLIQDLAAETHAREVAEAELRETAGALSEATALLERVFLERVHIARMCMAALDPKLTLDIKDHLRAPAQPAAPTPDDGNESFKLVGGPWLEEQPAVPEPSAEPHGTGISCVDAEKGALRLAEGFAEQRDRAETAETKLAAVQQTLARVNEHVGYFAQDVAAARKNREPQTGMHAPYHGAFCSAPPTVIRDLERQVRALQESLLTTAGPNGGAK